MAYAPRIARPVRGVGQEQPVDGRPFGIAGRHDLEYFRDVPDRPGAVVSAADVHDHVHSHADQDVNGPLG